MEPPLYLELILISQLQTKSLGFFSQSIYKSGLTNGIRLLDNYKFKWQENLIFRIVWVSETQGGICEFYRNLLPQMSKISDMGINGHEMYTLCMNGWMKSG